MQGGCQLRTFLEKKYRHRMRRYEGSILLEDGLCAGLLLEEMSKQAEEPLLMNDFATAMKSAYQQAKDCFTEMLLNSFNGRRLVRAGYQEDVIYCSQRNISNLVPILTHNTLRAQVLKRLLVP